MQHVAHKLHVQGCEGAHVWPVSVSMCIMSGQPASMASKKKGTYTCVHTHTHTIRCTYINTRTHAHAHAHTHARTHTLARMRAVWCRGRRRLLAAPARGRQRAHWQRPRLRRRAPHLRTLLGGHRVRGSSGRGLTPALASVFTHPPGTCAAPPAMARVVPRQLRHASLLPRLPWPMWCRVNCGSHLFCPARHGVRVIDFIIACVRTPASTPRSTPQSWCLVRRYGGSAPTPQLSTTSLPLIS